MKNTGLQKAKQNCRCDLKATITGRSVKGMKDISCAECLIFDGRKCTRCPAMQPEIVQCKDCAKKGNSYLCRFDRDLEEHGSHRTDADDDWFCADGKRRKDE